MSTGPIFVVGMNGSGTTMLADCLGRHPHIYYSMPEESKVLPYYLCCYGQAGALDDMADRLRLAGRIGRKQLSYKPFDEAVPESSMHYMDAAVATKAAGRIVANSGKWKTYFDDKSLEDIERIAGKTLIEHGYPACIDGDVEPHVVMQSLWKIRDRIGFTLHFFKEYGLGAAPMFARHLAAATKQWTSARF